jgi:hypothetical protein
MVGGWNIMTFESLLGWAGERFLCEINPLFENMKIVTPEHAGQDPVIGCRCVGLEGPVLIKFDSSPVLPSQVQVYVGTDDARFNRGVQLRGFDANGRFIGADTSRSPFGPTVDGAKFAMLDVQHPNRISFCILTGQVSEQDKLLLGTVTAFA